MGAPYVFTDEAITIFNTAFAGKSLTDNEKYAMDRFIRANLAVSANGTTNFAKLVDISLFGGFDSQAKGLTKWISGANTNLVGTSSWAQATGVTTPGTAGNYIDTGFVPSTDGAGKYTLNNAGFGEFIMSGNNGCLFGTIGTTSTNQIFYNTNNGGTGAYLMRQHCSVGLSSGGTSGTIALRSYAGTRTSSGATATYRGGVNIQSVGSGDTSTGLPNRSVLLGARNNTAIDQLNAIVSGGWWAFQAVGFDHTVFEISLLNFYSELGV